MQANTQLKIKSKILCIGVVSNCDGSIWWCWWLFDVRVSPFFVLWCNTKRWKWYSIQVHTIQPVKNKIKWKSKGWLCLNKVADINNGRVAIIQTSILYNSNHFFNKRFMFLSGLHPCFLKIGIDLLYFTFMHLPAFSENWNEKWSHRPNYNAGNWHGALHNALLWSL